MSTHTPGPWTIEHTPDDETYIMDGDDNHVATVWRNRPEYEQHATLIAAAPAMYEALKAALQAIDAMPPAYAAFPYVSSRKFEIEKAIRLAEGRP